MNMIRMIRMTRMIRMIQDFFGGSKVGSLHMTSCFTWGGGSGNLRCLSGDSTRGCPAPRSKWETMGFKVQPQILTAHLSCYRFCMFLHVFACFCMFFFLDSFVKITLLFFKPPSNISGSYQRDNHSSSRTSRSLSMLYQFLSLLAIFCQHFNQSFQMFSTSPGVSPTGSTGTSGSGAPCGAPMAATLGSVLEKTLGGVNHPQTAQLFRWN